MKVALFTGTILLQGKNLDVREAYVIERLKKLKNYDLSIEVLTPKVEESHLPHFRTLDYNMYKICYRKKIKFLSVALFSSFKLFKLNCDIIHCYTYQAAFIAQMINFLKRNKYFVLFEPMGLAYEESTTSKNKSWRSKLNRSFVKRIEKRTFQKSNGVIVYTEIMRTYVSQEFDISIDYIYVVPHGVNIPNNFVSKKEDEDRFREKLHIQNENKIAMYVGSLSELHGVMYLAEAMNYLKDKKQDISLVILGSGPLELTLKKYIRDKNLDNIFIRGFVPSDAIPFYLSLADVLLIPHAKCMQTELDQPTKLFEYLSSGKPIVSFKLQAIKEVVGENAILVEPDNPKKFSDSLLQLLEDEDLMNKLGLKGKEIVRTYTWAKSSEKQYESYLKLMNTYHN
ncbi:glycosyltransferase involved in cell wall biosynthesis [Methanohalophilus levihalophilus]|uniref:glycosyltransferase n=1 Tax=Methanohalophilus levihalophilus TaxID=1431282 RepID=UPI001AE919D5|nr:glycosyltransferase [Methanohalophilus levihalophilus]MBP2029470.1 glycosyltransferase involved in cell wall biosynthesis [Methanohalophilus levihalophilus]